MTNSNVIDLDDNVLAICTKHPEMTTILENLGFRDITKPGMLQTAGRIMTLRKGAKLKKIDLMTIVTQLKSAGFSIKEDSHE